METPEANGELLLAGFWIGGRLMAVNAYLVDEIVRVPAVTPVPGASSYIHGVINLRGSIVVVVDLSRRIGLASAAGAPRRFSDDDRRVFVVTHEGERVGFLVDAADDVMEATKDGLKEAPPNLRGCDEAWFTGAYDGPFGLASILDVNALLDEA